MLGFVDIKYLLSLKKKTRETEEKQYKNNILLLYPYKNKKIWAGTIIFISSIASDITFGIDNFLHVLFVLRQ